MRQNIKDSVTYILKILKWKKNYKIGITNGCFDLLHKGHTYSLKQCKNMDNTKNRINHIITTKTEVLTNYSIVTRMDSLALEPDPVKTAIIFVMKSLRSTVQYSISKSKGKK